MGGGTQLRMAGEISPLITRLGETAAGVEWFAFSGLCGAYTAGCGSDTGFDGKCITHSGATNNFTLDFGAGPDA